MSGSFLGFILEGIVATLLVAAIAYCVIVNRKLEKLRADQENLKSIIRDLNQSTLHAEAAAGELRTTVEKASKELAIQINRAENSSAHLRSHNEKADSLLKRLSMVSRNAKDRTETAPFGSFSPRSGFPLEGAAAKEEVPEKIQDSARGGKNNPWPQLRLSNLSQHGFPEAESEESNPQPQNDGAFRRSRFQWET